VEPASDDRRLRGGVPVRLRFAFRQPDALPSDGRRLPDAHLSLDVQPLARDRQSDALTTA
jgi:hypothetical protein